MAGSADGPSRGRSVHQPPDDPRSEVEGQIRGADAERPVALLVQHDRHDRHDRHSRIDGHEVARRLEPYFEIIPTADLPTALALIADRRLDFVMVDATLPDPSMIELVAQARVRQWLRDLPIICYGTVAAGPAVSRLAGAAAHDIILEPVSTDELVARITVVLSPR
jgi:DNA-binding NarL/FixJ family response regulator